MKTTLNFMKLTFFVIAIMFMSCSPEDGRDGEQGQQGIAGQDGQDGQDGADGNANVIVSPWIDQDFATTPSSVSFFSHVDPQITLDVINTAAFLVYGKRTPFNNSIVVTQLPSVIITRSYYYNLLPESNTITFVAGTVDGSNTNFIDFTEFRYVIIPPSTSKGEKNHPNFSKMTYEEVMDYFELDY